MSNRELAEMLKGMDELRAELTQSPEKALAFLVEVGIVTPDGKLTEQYSKTV